MLEGHVAIVGLGLIGGSLGRALRDAGFTVVGCDTDVGRGGRAVEVGSADSVTHSVEEAAAGAACVFVAVPVGSIVPTVVAALDSGAGVVSDVGSVKGVVVRRIEAERPDGAERFVGGHPMAGSEQEGLDGVDADLFRGATWVLTPTTKTSDTAFTTVRGILSNVGAELVSLDPDEHDALVAVVSHVPHLAAGTLMLLAAREAAHEHSVLFRLAAGGFRDMTRIASGHPGIWPDICIENRDAIVSAMDRYLTALAEMRDVVASGDRARLLDALESAREARTNLPIAALEEGPLVELRVPVPDRPGVLAEVTTTAGQLGVNIVDLEIAHSLEGREGVVVLIVPETDCEALESGLAQRGYRVARRVIE